MSKDNNNDKINNDITETSKSQQINDLDDRNKEETINNNGLYTNFIYPFSYDFHFSLKSSSSFLFFIIIKLLVLK